MASTTSRRLVLRGRPPGYTGISPSISRHCSSVTSLGYLFVLIPTTYENHPLWDSHLDTRLLLPYSSISGTPVAPVQHPYLGSPRPLDLLANKVALHRRPAHAQEEP